MADYSKVATFLPEDTILRCRSLAIILLSSQAALFAAEGQNWVNEESWKSSGILGSQDYLKAAQTAEKKKDYGEAADLYEDVFEASTIPSNKALALFRLGLNQERNGDFYSAFESYKELLERYSSVKYFNDVVDGMVRIGEYYEKRRKKWFSNGLTRAIEVYEAILKLAPYSPKTGAVALNLAKLQQESIDHETSIATFEKILKDYRQDKDVLALAYFNLAQSYQTMSQKSDEDASLGTKGIEYAEQFIETFPEHKNVAEAREIRKSLREHVAAKLFHIGEFYTWEYNQYIPAARRYLHKILLNYGDTAAAIKAEALLVEIDPDYTPVVPIAKKAEKLAEKAKAQTPFERSKNKENWEPVMTIPVEPGQEGKWLLPLENIKGE